MATAQADKIATFRALHERGCFPLPNPWDAGSARYLQALGFEAVATTSSGFAATLAKLDYQITLEEALAHLEVVCAATDIPVNADFEGGFAVEPEGVATNVAKAVGTGVAGLSIEDRAEAGASSPLIELPLSVERIAAARAGIDGTGLKAVLTARCEAYLVGQPDLKSTIARLQAYAAAGADCLFAPGLKTDEDIRTVCAELAPLPVNVIAMDYGWTTGHLAELGVRRISIGGALARKAFAGAMTAAKAWLDTGAMDGLTAQPPLSFAEAFR